MAMLRAANCVLCRLADTGARYIDTAALVACSHMSRGCRRLAIVPGHLAPGTDLRASKDAFDFAVRLLQHERETVARPALPRSWDNFFKASSKLE